MQRTVKYLGVITCFIIISITLVGCFIPLPEHKLWEDSRSRGKIIESDLAFLVEGKTTREEVLLQFGEPDALLDDGIILVYYWATSHGIILASGIAQMATDQYLFFEFNPDSTLRRFKFKQPEFATFLPEKIEILQESIRKDIEEMDSSEESDTGE